MKGTIPAAYDAPEVVDGYEIRSKLDRIHGTERTEALVNGTWVLLWSSRPVSKGGSNAWTLRQQDLKKAVWETVHGRKPRLCTRCHLMLEGDVRLIRARSCGLCREFGT